MANKERRRWRSARLHAREAVYGGTAFRDPPKLLPAKHAKPANGVHGGIGAMPFGARRQTAKGGIHPNAGAGVEAVKEGEVARPYMTIDTLFSGVEGD
jgi:hypothetical protein